MGYDVPTCALRDYGDDGCLLSTPSPFVADCAVAYPPFLERESGSTAYPVDQFAHDFACIGMLGTRGCGFEQHLKAAEKAIGENAAGCNAGFLRDRSVTAVIFVTDENDCSVSPAHPDRFVEAEVSPGGTFGVLDLPSRKFVVRRAQDGKLVRIVRAGKR